MKKMIMAFTMMAFLMGGLTISANAQAPRPKNAEQSQAINGATVNLDEKFSEYKTNVNKYITATKKVMNGNSTNVFNFNRNQRNKSNSIPSLYKAAKDVETCLETNKKRMDKIMLENYYKKKQEFASAVQDYQNYEKNIRKK